MQDFPRNLQDKIFKIKTKSDFDELAIEVFRFQVANNFVYRNYINALKFDPSKVKNPVDIPRLSIEFYKSLPVQSFNGIPEVVFTSSGTTGEATSRHMVKSVSIYEESFLRGFKLFYNHPRQYCLLALLPSYIERKDSSLVYMAEKLIKETSHPFSGFYLNNLEELTNCLKLLELKKQKVLLLGVSFALLDLAEKFPQKLKHTIIMETGGMKGRRAELTREELHDTLIRAFGVEKIHSEYGMTELLSQAYSYGDGKYFTPPWMKVSIRDIYDPFSNVGLGKTGGINITDLANIYSCSFIETSDLGRMNTDGGFEVLGRLDRSDLRGCNLMVE